MGKTHIQDTILNQCRKDKIGITVITTNGARVKGNVEAYDGYTILMKVRDKGGKVMQNLIYKSAISTIIPDTYLIHNILEEK